MSSDPIEQVTARTISLPLPNPLRVGPMLVTERHYAVVRITTRDGLVGFAYGQSRGAPVTEIVSHLLEPVLIGADSVAVEDRWTDVFRSTMAVGRVGLVIRAISLVDIALWDIRAQRAGVPLYRALGGTSADVDVMAIVGYPSSADDVDEIVAVAQNATEAGHSLVKIARASDPSVTNEVLRRFDETLPASARFVVDGAWIWNDVAGPLDEVAPWPHERIAWLEDPFPPESVDAYRSLKSACPVPIGVGEELTDPSVHRALLDAGVADVLRIDVATIGGVTRAHDVAQLATERGVPVSFHIYPEISAHLAAAWPICENVETFDRSSNPYDPSHLLIDGGPIFERGRAKLLDRPGLSFTIDV